MRTSVDSLHYADAVRRAIWSTNPDQTEGVTPEDMAKMTWLEPRVVVHIGFVEWTTYGLLRHATFVGIRDDKNRSLSFANVLTRLPSSTP